MAVEDSEGEGIMTMAVVFRFDDDFVSVIHRNQGDFFKNRNGLGSVQYQNRFKISIEALSVLGYLNR